jgi:hypothetical protein
MTEYDTGILIKALAIGTAVELSREHTSDGFDVAG